MTRFTRWLLRRTKPEEVRRVPVAQGTRPSVADDVAEDASRQYNRDQYYRGAVPPVERKYSVSCALADFGHVGIPWGGTSWEDARDSFLVYLNDDAGFNDTGGRFPNYRSLYVKFNGQWRLLTFRTDWVAGFTVH